MRLGGESSSFLLFAAPFTKRCHGLGVSVSAAVLRWQHSRQGDKLNVTSVPKPRWTDPPDIRDEDAFTLSEIAVRYCRFPHPDVVKQLRGAVFPVVRVKGANGKRGTCDTVKDRSGQDRKVMYHDNATPRWALLWSHGFEQMAQPAGWTFAHLWDESDDPDAYTHLANLVMMPECFGGLVGQTRTVGASSSTPR